MEHVAATDGRALEIGSYFGRSTLFILAALGPGRELVAVDCFTEMGRCRGHTAAALLERLGDPRVTLIRTSMVRAIPLLAAELNSVALIDADHSSLGVSVDLALSIALSQPDGIVLLHDHTHEFPGVTMAASALVRSGVLVAIESVDSLTSFRVASRPSWLIEPHAGAHGDLPTAPGQLQRILTRATSRLMG